jgi:hypothetical protein
MFRAHVLIVRRSKLFDTASGIITPIGGRPMHRLRERNDQRGNQHHSRELLMMGIVVPETC